MSTKNVDDLLVFGYACKIFRDDEKALHIDQGKHLIPWMGDSTLKIDRYDVRAALSDVSQFEAPPGGYDNRLDYLSPAEQRAEQLCEEERYFSLYNNDFEEELYKEENNKRLNQGYGQVGFNYDQSSIPQNSATEGPTKAENDNKDEQSDEAYVPHARFYIPPTMDLPETLKVQAIIEKTARFISTQGPQMEILIKAKQANNPLFDFLNQSGRLNPFYKHTLQAMKDGNYPTENNETDNTQGMFNNNTTGSLYQNYYSSNTPVVPVPAIKYKPSADCAYTQLISKIKGVHKQAETTPPNLQPNDTLSITSEKPKSNVEIKQISNGLMLAQYYNSDSDDEEENQNDSNSNESSAESVSHIQQPNGNQHNNLLTIPTLSDEIPIPPGVMIPPSELKVIIEKTASYVLKNGKDFEDILRAKNDQRFTFLQYKDPYYKYYTFKLTGIVCPDPKDVITVNDMQAKSRNLNNSNSQHIKANISNDSIKTITPVSFSIKPKEESTTTSLKPALPMEHSSDEEVQIENSKTEQSSSASSKNIPLPSNIHPANSYLHSSNSAPSPKSKGDCNHPSTDVEQSDSFIRDTMLEQQSLNEKKLVKRAEDKVRDRLAQLAREKLGILSKEKQLQLERRRRAMAFLNQINGDDKSDVKSTKKGEIIQSTATTSETSSSKLKSDPTSDHSDSSDSVKFVMASSSTSICAAVTQTIQKRRNIRANRRSNESDDIIEIESRHSKSRSRSRSRASSTRRYRYKSKRSKKKSSKRRTRSRSRSRSSRYSRSSSRDYKQKKGNLPSKIRKHRYSDE